jgi:hypothetical protein
MTKYLLYGTFLLVVANLSLAAPQPAIVQGPGLWTVEVEFTHPQQIVLGRGPQGPRTYWYVIATVTNRTGQDVEFYPQCDLVTDTFQIVPAGRRVPPAVFELIKQRHADQYPFVESLDDVLEAEDNRILQGEDNTKDIALIWQDFDPEATGFSIFLKGLSNEIAVVDHPVAFDQAGEPVQVFLRKTLELDYSLRGDPALRGALQVAHKDTTWVMR